MKRILLFSILLLLFIGCDRAFDKDDITKHNNHNLPELIVSFDEETRTYVENNKYLRWHEGDYITAFVGNTLNNKYRFKGNTGDCGGAFSVITGTEIGSSQPLDKIYALYPYNSNTSITIDGTISYNFASTQTYATNSFGKDANVMIATTKSVDDTFLSFKNVGGYLKLKLYGEDIIKSIKIRGNNGEKITGAATIYTNYGAIHKVIMNHDAVDTITLDCGEGKELSPDKDNPTEFWITIPPIVFDQGITITTINTEGQIFTITTDKQVTIERNIIQPMAPALIEKIIEPVLFVTSERNIQMRAVAGEGTINFVVENPVDGVSATAEADKEWITIDSVSDTAVKFSAKANTGAESRQGTITIKYGEQSATVTVTQIAEVDYVITKIEAKSYDSANAWAITLFETDPVHGTMYTRITFELPEANTLYITDGTYSVANGTIRTSGENKSEWRYNSSYRSDITGCEMTISVDPEKKSAKLNGYFIGGGTIYNVSYEGDIPGFIYGAITAATIAEQTSHSSLTVTITADNTTKKIRLYAAPETDHAEYKDNMEYVMSAEGHQNYREEYVYNGTPLDITVDIYHPDTNYYLYAVAVDAEGRVGDVVNVARLAGLSTDYYKTIKEVEKHDIVGTACPGGFDMVVETISEDSENISVTIMLTNQTDNIERVWLCRLNECLIDDVVSKINENFEDYPEYKMVKGSKKIAKFDTVYRYEDTGLDTFDPKYESLIKYDSKFGGTIIVAVALDSDGGLNICNYYVAGRDVMDFK